MPGWNLEKSSHVKIDPQSRNIPNPLQDETSGDYYLGIAVFHQLHCLVSPWSVFYSLYPTLQRLIR